MTNLNAIKSFLDSRSILVNLVDQGQNLEIQGCCSELLRRHGNQNIKVKLTKYDLNEKR